MIGALLFGYGLFAFLAAVAIWELVFDGLHPVGPPGAEPALRFLFGLFWPLALVAGIALVTWSVLASVCGGFAALWRHLRGTRLPRAEVRK